LRAAGLDCARTQLFGPWDQFDPGLVSVGARVGWALYHKPKSQSMPVKLTDTQLVLLSAAAQRDDRCLTPASRLKAGAAQKIADKLIAAGFAKEIKSKTSVPVWRRDEETSQTYALKLTVAGAKASAESTSAEGLKVGGSREPIEAVDGVGLPRTFPETSNAGGVKIPSAPREGTKSAQIIAMLKSEDGATLAELIASTGWLPHTTRAALTGLRKRGYRVTLDRSDEARGSKYLIRGDQADGADVDVAPHDYPETDPVAQPGTEKRLPSARGRRAA
jgi:Protein of unknown function (DUF3489)